MSSISSFTLRLVVEQQVKFQSFSGFASCGVFYSLIKSVDEGFAEKLHSSKKLAPWAASPIFVEFPPPLRVAYRSLPAPSIANLTFSIMDDKLCEIFKEAIFKSEVQVDLINAKAKVVGVSVVTKKFSELFSNADPLPEKFAIDFITPTAFRKSAYECCTYCPHYVNYLISSREGRKGGIPCKYAVSCRGVLLPLPFPSLLFKNLARIWKAFSRTSLDVSSAARWAGDAITISGFPKGIRTVRVYEHVTTNKWIVGFMGKVRFSVRKELYSEKNAKIASALLSMAEMTNVGVRRTAGLGMVKYLPMAREERAPRGGRGADR